MRDAFILGLLVIGCGGKPAPKQKAACEDPAPGQAMTETMCQCRGGRIVLSTGGAVELHCEADEHELGAAKLGDREGWCCK